MKKKNVANVLAKFYLRYNRGSGLISFFTSMIHDLVYYGILMDLAYRYLHITIPAWIIVPLVLGAIIVYYFLGLVDEKVGFWKIQNDYSYKELTPFFEERFKEINDKIDNIKK